MRALVGAGCGIGDQREITRFWCWVVGTDPRPRTREGTMYRGISSGTFRPGAARGGPGEGGGGLERKRLRG